MRGRACAYAASPDWLLHAQQVLFILDPRPRPHLQFNHPDGEMLVGESGSASLPMQQQPSPAHAAHAASNTPFSTATGAHHHHLSRGASVTLPDLRLYQNQVQGCPTRYRGALHYVPYVLPVLAILYR